ncbi:peptidylprolyl isomerase [Andreprevotia chitinilytica]|uniref:peptidylprolyl isomerase n=1 Tax=Andreprevotia chitinilytica TaxID=396808 RepID=UPI0005589ECE|nr:peptidylprolyl isomerase [Andreprevotia chitinilytica]
MKQWILVAALVVASTFGFAADSKAKAVGKPQVEFVTSKGKIVVELYPEIAPESVANFLQYVKDKHYDGTIFHRVIAGFVVQGGGMDAKMNEKQTRAPIKNEAQQGVKAGLKNDRGTIAMARTGDPNSATSQFYFNLKDNDFLNWPSRDGYGYAAFGRVVVGQDVVDNIAKVQTVPGDVPAEPIVIKSAREIAAVATK